MLVRIERVHADEGLLVEGERDRIDPDKWRPLIMSFQQFYGLAPGRLHDSTLGKIPEALYRPAAGSPQGGLNACQNVYAAVMSGRSQQVKGTP